MAANNPLDGLVPTGRHSLRVENFNGRFNARYYHPSVACAGPNQAWVKTDDQQLQRVQLQGGQIVSIETLNTNFRFKRLVISAQGDILLSDVDNNCIQSISGDIHRIVQILFATQWQPYGLCCLNNGNLVVTFFDEGRVVIYDMAGHVIHELDDNLFHHPCSVAENVINGGLYIADVETTPHFNSGQVVFLDVNFQFRFCRGIEYKTEHFTNFCPLDICSDNVGFVLIADYANSRVLIVDTNGNQFPEPKYFLTGQQGLQMAYSVDVDNAGNAWIGDSRSYTRFGYVYSITYLI